MNEYVPISKKPPFPFLNSFPVNAGLATTVFRDALHFSTEWPFQHTLVGTGSQRHDPWALAQHGLSQNPHFSPLIAVNPLWDHPVACARRVLTLNFLYGPRLALNIVPGAYFAEMEALGDQVNKDGRFKRAREFCVLLAELLRTGTWEPREMEFFPFGKISLGLAPLSELPPLFLSGARRKPLPQSAGWHPRFVSNIRPLDSMEPAPPGASSGLRLGLCARSTSGEALAAVAGQFPENRERQMLVATTLWREETDWNLLLRARLPAQDDPDFFLSPLLNGWTTAPYLVGSYEHIARRLREYLRLGYEFFLLDEHRSDEDRIHFGHVLAALRWPP
jgi:alkanesulfonate monooxygenase